MASLFWVGGSTAYDGVTNTMATTTGGTATVAAIAAGDTVTFDSLSPAGAAVTTTAAISCTSIAISLNFTGSITLGNTLTTSSVVTHNGGTLNTNGQTCTWGSYSSSNSTARTISMGASAIEITSTGATVWDVSTATNYVVTANTSTITFTGNGTTTFQPGGSARAGTYNNIVSTGSGTFVLGTVSSGNTVGANFTRTGTVAKTDAMTFGSAGFAIFSNSITFQGNSTTSRLLLSGTFGAQKTFRAPTYVLSNVDFSDISLLTTGNVAANATGTSLGDSGGNAGIVFDTPVTQHFTNVNGGTTSTAGNWTSRVPLPQDDVIFDTAFGTSKTISSDMPRLGASWNFSGATWTTALTLSLTASTTVYGNITWIAGLTHANGNSITLSGRGSYSFDTKGVLLSSLVFSSPGTYTLASDVTALNNVRTFSIGNLMTFDANGFNVNYGQVIGAGSSSLPATVKMGSGTWTVNGTGSVWNNNVSWVVQAQTSTIVISDTSATTKTFAGGGATYNIVSYTVTATGTLSITGSNTFGTLNVGPGRTLTFSSTTTNSVTNWNVNGVAGSLVTLTSSIAASAATISPSGPIESAYLSVKDSTIGNGMVAYDHAGTDATGNTGWVFLDGDFSFNNYEFVRVGDGMSVGGDKIR